MPRYAKRIWYVFQTHPALRTCAVLCKSGMNTCLRDKPRGPHVHFSENILSILPKIPVVSLIFSLFNSHNWDQQKHVQTRGPRCPRGSEGPHLARELLEVAPPWTQSGSVEPWSDADNGRWFPQGELGQWKPKFTTPKNDQNCWDLHMLNPKKICKNRCCMVLPCPHILKVNCPVDGPPTSEPMRLKRIHAKPKNRSSMLTSSLAVPCVNPNGGLGHQIWNSDTIRSSNIIKLSNGGWIHDSY